MDLDTLVTYVREALMLILLLSVPTILVAGVAGLLMAFLQAVTQVQDQTISFSVKLVAVIVAIALTSGWLGGELYNFANQMLAAVPGVH